MFTICCFPCCFLDIPEDEARYWAKKLEQLNAMRDQDVSCQPVSFHTLEHPHDPRMG